MYIIVNEKIKKKVKTRNRLVERFLLELNLNPATSVVVQNGKILTEKDEIDEGETIYIYTTTSFG